MPTSPTLACFALALSASIPAAELKLPAILGDHMVVQREETVRLWGWAAPGDEVSLVASWGIEAETDADPAGAFLFDVDTPPAGGPYMLTFSSGDETLVVDDVLSGEVWVASGQSNMEMPVAYVGPGYPGLVDWEQELAGSDAPELRLFRVENAFSASEQSDVVGSWAASGPESARGFSAVGWVFARTIHEELGVPVGIIDSTWGGTPAEAWTSAEGLAAHGGFEDALATIERERADPEGLARDARERRAAWWRALAAKDPGTSGETPWFAPELDDSGWATIALPRAFEDSSVGAFDGVVWFRREVKIPPALVGQPLTLELGPIDDMDTVWFAGQRVGGYEVPGHYRRPRVYGVPGSLVGATATIAVRVLDTGGAGGLWGNDQPMRLVADESTGEEPLALTGTWRVRAGAPLSAFDRFPASSPIGARYPTALHNAMIAPIAPLRIRGAIWYQGESNRPRAWQYRTLFSAMIEDWRRVFRRPQMPFYFVQIAPFGYGGDTGQAAELREAQALALELPATGMAVTLDVGDAGDIHPRKKREVGERLARWALAETYDRELDSTAGPMVAEATVEGDAVVVRFDHADGGLALDEAAAGFEVSDAEGSWHPAEASVDGASLRIRSDAVETPIDARYAWSAAPSASFFNGAGLPAAPFRTGSWEWITKP